MSMGIAAYLPPPHTNELPANTALGPSLEPLGLHWRGSLLPLRRNSRTIPSC